MKINITEMIYSSDGRCCITRSNGGGKFQNVKSCGQAVEVPQAVPIKCYHLLAAEFLNIPSKITHVTSIYVWSRF